MSAKGQHGIFGCLEFFYKFSAALCRIDMEKDISCRQFFPDFMNRLNDTCFIIHMHNTDKQRVLLDSLKYLLWINTSRRIWINKINLKASAFHFFNCFQDSLVLDSAGYYVLFSAFTCVIKQPLNCNIITFGCPASEKDLARSDVQ